MASGGEGLFDSDEVNRLKNIFNDGEQIVWKLEKGEYESNNLLQESVLKAKTILEKATRTVSALNLFSSNESLEDIPTNDIRYLLLPAYLGVTTLKISNEDRKHALDVAEEYFRDFIRRCQTYEIISEKLVDERLQPKPMSKVQNNLAALSKQRQDKIARYNKQKDRDKQLEELKSYVQQQHVDDEVKRKYFLLLIDKWIDKCFEEIESLSLEKKFLEMRPSASNVVKQEPSKSKPLKPIIITKNDLQKKVFGAGYPSIPTMTLDEFYDKSIQNGHLPDSIPSTEQEASANKEDDEEEDSDDPEKLQKQRAMDDWKDDHRRGWGNRMNRS